MKRLFLASSIDTTGEAIAKEIGKKGLRLLFITTASEAEGGNMEWFEKDKKALVNTGFAITDYSITGKKMEEIEEALKNTDIICMEGGNSFYLLEKIQQTGCKEMIKDFVEKGKIYIGSSAGSVVAGPDIYPTFIVDSVKKAPNLKDFKGLNLVNFVTLPHWGSEFLKELYLNKRLKLAYSSNNKFILLTDYQYIKVEDDMYKIVDIREK